MNNLSIFFEFHSHDLITFVFTCQDDRIFLTEHILSTTNKDTELEGMMIFITDIEVDNLLSESLRKFVNTSLVKRKGVAHHDAFGTFRDVDLVGQDMGAKGE